MSVCLYRRILLSTGLIWFFFPMQILIIHGNVYNYLKWDGRLLPFPQLPLQTSRGRSRQYPNTKSIKKTSKTDGTFQGSIANVFKWFQFIFLSSPVLHQRLGAEQLVYQIKINPLKSVQILKFSFRFIKFTKPFWFPL